jgi:hypothetical protein
MLKLNLLESILLCVAAICFCNNLLINYKNLLNSFEQEVLESFFNSRILKNLSFTDLKNCFFFIIKFFRILIFAR